VAAVGWETRLRLRCATMMLPPCAVDSVIQVVGGCLGRQCPGLVASDWLAAMGAFLTREEAIKKQPEVLGGFLRALYMSFIWRR